MPRRVYFLVIGIILTWGFFLTSVIAKANVGWDPAWWESLLVCIIPFIGVFLSFSKSAMISFVGFHLVALPFGVLLGPYIAHHTEFNPGMVEQVALFTAAITAVMATSGLLFPRFYEKIGGALFMGLIGLIVVMVLENFIPALQGLEIVHYFGVGLFALYIGYDMHVANSIPATLDNAVDSAVALYLDIVNLFLQANGD